MGGLGAGGCSMYTQSYGCNLCIIYQRGVPLNEDTNSIISITQHCNP